MRLIKYSTRVTDLDTPLINVSYWEYLKLRVNIRKWRLHRTMGRPVLVLRKEDTPNAK